MTLYKQNCPGITQGQFHSHLKLFYLQKINIETIRKISFQNIFPFLFHDLNTTIYILRTDLYNAGWH